MINFLYIYCQIISWCSNTISKRTHLAPEFAHRKRSASQRDATVWVKVAERKEDFSSASIIMRHAINFCDRSSCRKTEKERPISKISELLRKYSSFNEVKFQNLISIYVLKNIMYYDYIIILLNPIHVELSPYKIHSAVSNCKSDPAPIRNGWVNVPGSHGHCIITRPLKFPVRKSDNELGRPEFFGRKQATQSRRWQSTRINIAISGWMKPLKTTVLHAIIFESIRTLSTTY